MPRPSQNTVEMASEPRNEFGKSLGDYLPAGGTPSFDPRAYAKTDSHCQYQDLYTPLHQSNCLMTQRGIVRLTRIIALAAWRVRILTGWTPGPSSSSFLPYSSRHLLHSSTESPSSKSAPSSSFIAPHANEWAGSDSWLLVWPET